MRTIEFRGKRVDNGEWVYGYVDATMYKDIVVIHTETGTFVVNPETVGQFTGLHDDFGVEIFEGDITRCTNLMEQGLCDKMICEIVYDEDLACFELKAEDRQRCLCTSILDIGISVIGNIHDNPELMEGGEE